MAFMGLAYLIWNRLVASCGVIGQFDVNNIDVKLFLSCIRSPGIQRATVKRFIEAIFTRNIITGFSPVTFASSVIIVLVALELLYLNHKATFSKPACIPFDMRRSGIFCRVDCPLRLLL